MPGGGADRGARRGAARLRPYGGHPHRAGGRGGVRPDGYVHLHHHPALGAAVPGAGAAPGREDQCVGVGRPQQPKRAERAGGPVFGPGLRRDLREHRGPDGGRRHCGQSPRGGRAGDLFQPRAGGGGPASLGGGVLCGLPRRGGGPAPGHAGGGRLARRPCRPGPQRRRRAAIRHAGGRAGTPGRAAAHGVQRADPGHRRHPGGKAGKRRRQLAAQPGRRADAPVAPDGGRAY